MKNKIIKIHLFLYYFFFSKLPNSAFPMGAYFNMLRLMSLKHILSIGDNCKVQRNVYIGNGLNIQIGNNCRINDNVRLDNVRIGDNSMIARDCIFLGKMHEYNNLSIPMIQQGEKEVKRTVLEENIWIGARVIIMPGIHIAQGCIIGAGSVVTKDTLNFGIYAGVPAKLIKQRK